jgi:hypothetical protein
MGAPLVVKANTGRDGNSPDVPERPNSNVLTIRNKRLREHLGQRFSAGILLDRRVGVR